MTGYQVCKLCIEGYLARLAQVQQRQFVEHIGQPLAFPLIGHIHTPQRILDGLIPHRRLGGKRHFGHMHDGCTQHQVRAELVVQVQPHHRLALHIIGCLVLQRHTDRRSGRNNTLVQDGDDTRCIVYRIIHILRQDSTSRRHLHGTARHIGCPQLYLRTRRSLVLTFQAELVFLGNLAGDGKRRVVQFLEHIFIGNRIIINLLPQVRTERLHAGEDDLPILRQDSVAVYKVEDTIRMAFIVRVEVIQVQDPEQDLVGNRPFRQVVHVCTGRIALVHDVQFKLLLLHRISP